MNDAAAHQLDRTDQEIRLSRYQCLLPSLLARKQQEVAEQSVKTAQAITDRSQSRFDAGLVVESDLLTAKVRLGRKTTGTYPGQKRLELARAQLNLAMGLPAESMFQPAEVCLSGRFRSPRWPDL